MARRVCGGAVQEDAQTLKRTTDLTLDNGKTWTGKTYYVRK